MVYDTPAGATLSSKPVDAVVDFTTSADTVHIVLRNLQADPKLDTECLSGLRFHLSSGQNTGMLTSSSGIDRSITSGGAYSDAAAPVSTGWSLLTVGSDLMLDLLSTNISPTHTIVGPPNGSNLYASGNPSITSGSHNPHIALSATFDLHVTGVTSASTITSAIFQFDTPSGKNVAGVVPEPASIGLIVVTALGLLQRRH